MSDVLDLGLLSEDGGGSFIPKASLVQQTSKVAKTGGVVGKLHITGTDFNVDSLNLVPLGFKQGRLWFVGNNTSYFCRSDDQKVPITSDNANFKQQAGNCSECPKSKWNGRTSPPSCNEYVEITFANLSDKTNPVIVMSFQKGAYKDASMALLKMSEGGGASYNKVTVRSQIVRGRDFNYYIPVFENITALEQEEENFVAPLRAKHLHVPQTEQKAEVSQEDSDFRPDLLEIDLED